MHWARHTQARAVAFGDELPRFRRPPLLDWTVVIALRIRYDGESESLAASCAIGLELGDNDEGWLTEFDGDVTALSDRDLRVFRDRRSGASPGCEGTA